MDSQPEPSSIREGLCASEKTEARRFEDDKENETCMKTPVFLSPLPASLILHFSNRNIFDGQNLQIFKSKVCIYDDFPFFCYCFIKLNYLNAFWRTEVCLHSLRVEASITNTRPN
jgi:hypothetical protein